MARTRRKLHRTRLWALALCLLLVMTALPGRAAALSGTTGGLSWSLTGGTLRISGAGAMPNYSDAAMPPWYESATAVNRIVVGEGVTSVGDLAFYGCSAAVRANLPSTVTAIGDRAFKNCTALTWLNLPEGLVSIGDAAFERCEALNGILLPQSLRSIGNFAFERCSALTGIVIPAGVTELGMVVFYHCTGLTRAVIQCPIEKIPDWFFYGCTALNEVELPETVTQTGDEAFHDCGKLSTVYYSGAAAQDIQETLRSDDGTRFAAVSEGGVKRPTASSTVYDEKTDTSVTVTVTQTEQAVVTQTTKTSYTYAVNGAQATLEEVWAAAETEEVAVNGVASSVITATVSGSDGWSTVADTVKTAARKDSNSESVQVQVQLTNSTVNASDLANLARVDAKVAVATSEGCVWVVDTAEQSKRDFGSGVVDLGFSVEPMESAVSGIESRAVYQVEFASDVNFETKVGVPVKVGNAQQVATMYAKTGSKVTEACSAVVDNSGYAWFPVETVSRKTEYYVAINAEGADRQNAVIPDSLMESYNVDYKGTLTDSAGNQYEIGQRESRWGITGKQFTIYVLIAIAAVVFIVTGVMITLNKINRSKAKYAAMAAAEDDYEIDEDALRLQVMQEMLEEARRENGGE